MTPRTAKITLAVAAVAFFAYNIGGYDLWAPDEPRFAQVAREMLDSANWFAPHVNGEPYMEKPPVFFWAIAAVSAPFGDVSAITARIPSVAAAVLTVLLTYSLALRLFNDRIAWWAAIVLMTTSRFWWQARTAQIDMVLTALLAVTLYAFWRQHESPSRAWRTLFFAAIAAALLTKGPVGILFPLLLWLTFYWRRRGQRKQFPIALGAAVSIALALAWLVPARMAVSTGDAGGAIGEDFYRQVIGRVFLGVSKAQSPWYYLINLPVDLMPWTLIVPWSIVWAWRQRHTDTFRLLMAWTLPALILFSAFSGKRQIYILPLYPAFAIMIAASLPSLIDDARTRYRTIATAAWIVALLAISSLPFVIEDRYPEFATPGLYWFPVIGLIAVVVLCADWWRNGARRLPALLAIPIAACMVAAAHAALPKLNEAKSARAFCAPLQTLVKNEVDYRLYSFMFSREEYIFYAHHFHETVFVDTLPGHDERNLEHVEALVLAIGDGFLQAVESVTIQSAASLTDAEIESLRDALNAFHQSLIETNPKSADAYAAIESGAHVFAAEFLEPTPAYMFIQTRDWPWLRALIPEFGRASVVAEENIGSRHVLLIANESGAANWPD